MKAPNRNLLVVVICCVLGVHIDAAHPDCPPTISPAPTETAAPSPSPSEAPTDSPAPSETSSPTIDVSAAPTEKSPTVEPTESPAPSPSPSEVPTQNPTQTLLPSHQPSKGPSPQPSNAPSLIPSDAPSLTPTEQPSTSPSPSTRPTIQPSESSRPSEEPSFAPSNYPSSKPSVQPSASTDPSRAPSSAPTSSAYPSEHPSASPTIEPQPSEVPSSAPSSSLYPSADPSAGQTISSYPSRKPSSAPQASGYPSDFPSTFPSTTTSGRTPVSEIPFTTPNVSISPSGPPYSEVAPTSSQASSYPDDLPSSVPSVSINRNDSPSGDSPASTYPDTNASNIPSTGEGLRGMPSVAPSTGDLSEVPSDTPSKPLSDMPSAAPSIIGRSEVPSTTPSKQPSKMPSSAPSMNGLSEVPSTTPSKHPSKMPSSAPSINSLSEVPSEAPSQRLSEEPSSAPSAIGRSAFPSAPPSEPRSEVPSSAPSTIVRSEAPSATPSKHLSGVPSSAPSTIDRSEVPSGTPSRHLSEEPSSAPSVVGRTEVPSSTPSKKLSEMPSSAPWTIGLSEAPSATPSKHLSEEPTSTPSIIPQRNVPSATPSKHLSEMPSSSPSIIGQSEVTSVAPSQPSSAPAIIGQSEFASATPSRQLSELPSSAPSVMGLSEVPSATPSARIGEIPSVTPSKSAHYASAVPSVSLSVTPFTTSPPAAKESLSLSPSDSISHTGAPNTIPTQSPSTKPSESINMSRRPSTAPSVVPHPHASPSVDTDSSEPPGVSPSILEHLSNTPSISDATTSSPNGVSSNDSVSPVEEQSLQPAEIVSVAPDTPANLSYTRIPSAPPSPNSQTNVSPSVPPVTIDGSDSPSVAPFVAPPLSEGPSNFFSSPQDEVQSSSPVETPSTLGSTYPTTLNSGEDTWAVNTPSRQPTVSPTRSIESPHIDSPNSDTMMSPSVSPASLGSEQQPEPVPTTVNTPAGPSTSPSLSPGTVPSGPSSGIPNTITGSPSLAPDTPSDSTDLASRVPSSTPSLLQPSPNISSRHPSTAPSVDVLNPVPTAIVQSTNSPQPSQFILASQTPTASVSSKHPASDAPSSLGVSTSHDPSLAPSVDAISVISGTPSSSSNGPPTTDLAASPAPSLLQSPAGPSLSPTSLLLNSQQPNGILAPTGSTIPTSTSLTLQPFAVSEAPSLAPVSTEPGSEHTSGAPHEISLPAISSHVPSVIDIDSQSPTTPTTPMLPSQSPAISPRPTSTVDPPADPMAGAPPSISAPTISAHPSVSPLPTKSASPSVPPSVSMAPSSPPSSAPSSSPSAGVRRHTASLKLSLDKVAGTMSEIDRAIFETVAVRLLIDLFPQVENISIDFIFVDVIDQSFDNGGRLRQLQQSASTGVLTIDIVVAADIWPGEPENFNFEWVIETFFNMNFDELLARLAIESDYFQPASVQDAPGATRQVNGNGDDEGGFSALPLVVGFATGVVAVVGIGTFLVRRSEDRQAEGNEIINLAAMSYDSEYPPEHHSSGGSYYSGIKPRRQLDEDNLSPTASGRYSQPDENSLVSFFRQTHFSNCGEETVGSSHKTNQASTSPDPPGRQHKQSIDPSACSTSMFSDSRYTGEESTYWEDSEENSVLYDIEEMKKLEESVKRSQKQRRHQTEKKDSSTIGSRVLNRLVEREVEENGSDAGVSMEAILMATSAVPSEEGCQSKKVLTLEERVFSTIVPVEGTPTPRDGPDDGFFFQGHILPSFIPEEDEDYQSSEDDECEVALPLGQRHDGSPDVVQPTLRSRIAGWFRRNPEEEFEDFDRKPSTMKEINTRRSYDCPGAIDSPRYDDGDDDMSQNDDDCSRDELSDREHPKKGGRIASALGFFRRKQNTDQDAASRSIGSDRYFESSDERNAGESGSSVVQRNNNSTNLEMHTPVWYSEEPDQAFGFVGIGPRVSRTNDDGTWSEVETPLSAHPTPSSQGNLVQFFTIKGNKKSIVPAHSLSNRSEVAMMPFPTRKTRAAQEPTMEMHLEENDDTVILGTIDEEFGGMELEWGNSI